MAEIQQWTLPFPDGICSVHARGQWLRRTRALWTDCSALTSRPEGVLHRGLDPEAPLGSADGSMELLSVVSPLGFAAMCDQLKTYYVASLKLPGGDMTVCLEMTEINLNLYHLEKP
ncbi:hypothetical protein CapIbe_003932 [Capra ibex]